MSRELWESRVISTSLWATLMLAYRERREHRVAWKLMNKFGVGKEQATRKIVNLAKKYGIKRAKLQDEFDFD